MPNLVTKYRKDRGTIKVSSLIGQKFKNNAGHTATVILHASCSEVTVRFPEPYYCILVTSAGQLRKGNFKNKKAPSVFGWGITGDVKRSNPAYSVWHSMLKRCLSEKSWKDNPTYEDADICMEWRRLENFEKWYNEQIKEEGWQLDKDWLIPGNLLYSPTTCVFVPPEVNTFLVDHHAAQGDYPMGVSLQRSRNKLVAQLSIKGSQTPLGRFDTVEEASRVYVQAKEKYAKRLATVWKNKIDPKLYTSMMEYTVNEYRGTK